MIMFVTVYNKQNINEQFYTVYSHNTGPAGAQC